MSYAHPSSISMDPIVNSFSLLHANGSSWKRQGLWQVLGILQSWGREWHSGEGPFHLDPRIDLELLLHVLIRSASSHWASPKSLLQPLWTQRPIVLLTLMTYVQWTFTTWARTTGSGCSPLTITKNSSAPENFWVPPLSDPCQACGLVWIMAKIVFTNIHCGCVVVNRSC